MPLTESIYNFRAKLSSLDLSGCLCQVRGAARGQHARDHQAPIPENRALTPSLFYHASLATLPSSPPTTNIMVFLLEMEKSVNSKCASRITDPENWSSFQGIIDVIPIRCNTSIQQPPSTSMPVQFLST